MVPTNNVGSNKSAAKDLKFTVETKGSFNTNKIPTLEFTMWMETGPEGHRI